MINSIELMKEKNYKIKMIPIICDNINLNVPASIIKLYQYWGAKICEMEYEMKQLDDPELYKELKNLRLIKNEIAFIINKDLKNAPPLKDCMENGFIPIIERMIANK